MWWLICAALLSPHLLPNFLAASPIWGLTFYLQASIYKGDQGASPLKPHQRLCLWTPRRVFNPLDTHFAIELSALSGYARVLIRPLSRRSGQRGLAAIKVNKHGCAPEGVKGAIGKPPCRARRREIPACGKEPLWSQDQLCGRAHLARQYAASWIERLGGAPAGAQSYWQGRFAACAFVGGFLGIGRP